MTFKLTRATKTQKSSDRYNRKTFLLLLNLLVLTLGPDGHVTNFAASWLLENHYGQPAHTYVIK